MHTVKAGQLRTWKPGAGVSTTDDIQPGDIFLVTETYVDRTGHRLVRFLPIGHRSGWQGGACLADFILHRSEPVEVL